MGFLRWLIFWGTCIGSATAGYLLADKYLPRLLSVPLPDTAQEFWPAKKSMQVADRALTVSPETRTALNDRNDTGSWILAIFKEVFLGIAGMIFGFFAALASVLLYLLIGLWNILHVPLIGIAAALFLWAVIAAVLRTHVPRVPGPAIVRTARGPRRRNRYIL